MNESGPDIPAARPSHLRPESELTVYYFNGRLPAQTPVDNSRFIGNWEEDGDSFLFFTGPAPETIAELTAAHPHMRLVDEYRLSYAEWLGEKLVPIRAGRFVITPSWEARTPPDKGEASHRILLDPGVVFGTGTHATTGDCLAAIESACLRKTPQSVVDIGTGTGLLALAAARMGAGKVLAVDLNPLAVLTAQHNVRLNRMQRRILVTRGTALDFACRPADLLIANVHYEVMQRLLDSKIFADCKSFILSGLLATGARAVTARLSQRSACILQQWSRDGVWRTFYGRNGSGRRETACERSMTPGAAPILRQLSGFVASGPGTRKEKTDS
jgi:ribosomal protein L11 methyltransferase